jgi:hypothetical protein
MNPSVVGLVKDALNTAITRAFLLPIGATALAAAISLGMEWRQIEDDRVPSPGKETRTGANENGGTASDERPAGILVDCPPIEGQNENEMETKEGRGAS